MLSCFMATYIKKYFLILLAAGIAFCCVFSPAYANLIRNPSFEKGSSSPIKDWTTLIWNGGAVEFQITDNMAHSGSKALAIINKDKDLGSCSQVVDVQAGRTYKFSCWIKTENVGTEPGARGAHISVNNNPETSVEIAGSDPGWALVELYIVMEAEADQNITNRIVLHLNLGDKAGFNAGTAYFDEAVLEESAGIPENSRVTRIAAVPGAELIAENQEGLFVDAPGREGEKRTLTLFVLFVMVIIFIVAGWALYLNIRKIQRFSRKTYTGKTCFKHKRSSQASRLRRLSRLKCQKFKDIPPGKNKTLRSRKTTGKKSKSV